LPRFHTVYAHLLRALFSHGLRNGFWIVYLYVTVALHHLVHSRVCSFVSRCWILRVLHARCRIAFVRSHTTHDALRICCIQSHLSTPECTVHVTDRFRCAPHDTVASFVGCLVFTRDLPDFDPLRVTWILGSTALTFYTFSPAFTFVAAHSRWITYYRLVHCRAEPAVHAHRAISHASLRCRLITCSPLVCLLRFLTTGLFPPRHFHTISPDQNYDLVVLCLSLPTCAILCVVQSPRPIVCPVSCVGLSV